MDDLITDVKSTTPAHGNPDNRYDHHNNHNNANAAINALDADKVSKGGDTMSGPLVLSGDPVDALGAATKQFVLAHGGGGGGTATWGDIIGTLSAQADLQAALDAKLSSVHYNNTNPSTVSVGGIPAGSTFVNELLSDLFDALFYPYQVPLFSAFAISGQAQSVEVGTTISGSKTFTWSSANSANVQAASVSVKQDAASLASGLGANGPTTASVISVQKTTPDSQTWSVNGTDTHSTPFSRNFIVNWLWKAFNGTSSNATLTDGQISALASNRLASAGAGTYSFAAGGYKYICYPASFPAAVNFVDTLTLLSVAMADSSDDASYSHTANGWSYALVNVTNGFSIVTSYRVYRTKFTLGSSINIGVS